MLVGPDGPNSYFLVNTLYTNMLKALLVAIKWGPVVSTQFVGRDLSKHFC